MIEVNSLDFKGWKFPFRVGVEVDFPKSFTHKGELYCQSGKFGVTVKTRIPCAEYAKENSIIWVSVDGEVNENC